MFYRLLKKQRQKMRPYKKKVINKLFYNKYPYKILCKLEGAFLLRAANFKDADYPPILDKNIPKFVEEYTRKNIKLFAQKFRNYFLDSDIFRSVSYRDVSFYFLDKTKFTEALTSLQEFVSEASEPASDLDLSYLQNNNKIILCNNLPHDLYQFKIIFRKMPLKNRESFLRWTKSYTENELYIPKSTKKFFSGVSNTEYYAHYAYVKDESIKILACLAAPGYVRSIEEYVLRSLINNDIIQEQPCPL